MDTPKFLENTDLNLEEKSSMVKEWIQKNVKGDPVIWTVVILLSITSLWVVYSATGTIAYKHMGGDTEHFLFKQFMYLSLCIGAMWFVHRIDYKYFSKIARILLWLSAILLVFSSLFGTSVNEANRWITIPFINQSFQPSDLAKFALIASLASILAKNQQNVTKAYLPIILWSGVICGLIAYSNFSTAVMLFATCLLIMFIGRVPIKHLMLLVLSCALFGSVALAFGQRLETVKSRVEAFLDTEHVPFQLEQSYIAIATGGVTGKGPGNSTQRNFLPLSYADFIYAIIIEEYGLIGGAFILFLYLVLLYRGMIIVGKSERAFGGLLSAGLSFLIVIQALINMGVTVGLGPVTGQTLPLISMGGTSLLFTGISLGIVLSVSRGESKA